MWDCHSIFSAAGWTTITKVCMPETSREGLHSSVTRVADTYDPILVINWNWTTSAKQAAPRFNFEPRSCGELVAFQVCRYSRLWNCLSLTTEASAAVRWSSSGCPGDSPQVCSWYWVRSCPRFSNIYNICSCSGMKSHFRLFNWGAVNSTEVLFEHFLQRNPFLISCLRTIHW